MAIKIALHHRTSYQYEKAISLGPQVIQLRPSSHCRTPILSYALDVIPADRLLNWQLDPLNNRLARLIFPSKTAKLQVDVNLVADLTPYNPFDFFLEPEAAEFPFDYKAETARDLEPYLRREEAGPRLKAFVSRFAARQTGTITLLLELNNAVRDAVTYVSRLEHGTQSCEETLEKRSGSCRDSAWVLVESLRNLRMAARFVSGYLIQLATGEPDGPTEDFAELHAWAEVFLPGAGWIGMDPTSGLLAGEGHISLVCTPTAAQAAPVAGTAERARTELTYSISVTRLDGSSSLAKPFTEEQWQRIRQVAHGIDKELVAHDARLTMGGEPTYVAIDDPENPQWNIEALGDAKKTRGLALIQQLRRRIAGGALLHYGQGKWYPGEALPRWAFSCYWRSDGVPVWEDGTLIAREDQDYGYGTAEASSFMSALARRLQASPANILAAYESEDATSDPAGYILALRRRQPEGVLRWSSQLWFEHPERLLLSPGDSPIGYRIPTEAMPWVGPDELAYEADADPFADRPRLPSRRAYDSKLFETDPPPDPLPAVLRDNATADVLIRPALCVQARAGRLHVFLPYLAVLADFLDLVSAVEDTCRYLKMPVWVEGYSPAPDPRLRSFSVTPDPGVIEVNLPPARNWDELEEIYTALDEEAQQDRLTAAKFEYNGNQIATGGGSHIVIGGATLQDSPILRHPDLLRSMLTFWQRHPSLSYLFSGLYVGPTSQCPRVDEARLDTLYELEVAFAQLPKSDLSPFVVDGLFRNLLADITGNTHRSEFCVDKLYAPQGRGSQFGLLELRAFEMPPHVRMNLLQMLLVRALVSMFWNSPLEGGLVRWGTTLHDRFMLPEFIRWDLAEVLSHLRRSGFDFDEQWFGAHYEFRFPKLGTLNADNVVMELRHALEPWNVLAEESVSGATVRSVDSSLDRIQVMVSGTQVAGRFAVTCNGRRVPLQPGKQDEVAVAGVRFRARKFSATLHPTVPVHAPLVFELIDIVQKRSIGQCSYHVDPHDGRVYTARPANDAEAQERRRARFQVTRSTPIAMNLPELEPNANFPLTLDLRRPAPGQEAPTKESAQ